MEFRRLEQFLETIKSETYPEAPSKLHTDLTHQMFEYVMAKCPLPPGAKVLDVGCGQGVALELFARRGLSAVGITLNAEDARICREKGYTVHEMDQSFLDFEPEEFDLIWSRHCLEHSVFPYFTLSEMFRVLKPLGWLYLEAPAPDTACRHQANRNHYSVLGKSMWMELIGRAGFRLIDVVDISFTVVAGPDVYWAFIQQKP